MPIYEYHCDRCGDFEEMQRITDPPLAKCPRCRKKVRRLISNTSFQLKGSGWYVTDYARGGNGKKKDGAAGTDGASGSASGDKASAGESKAASGGDKPTS